MKKRELKLALCKIGRILWAHYHLILGNKIISDKDDENMKPNDAGDIYQIIFKISNGSNTVQNLARSAVKSLYDLLFIRGGE